MATVPKPPSASTHSVSKAACDTTLSMMFMLISGTDSASRLMTTVAAMMGPSVFLPSLSDALNQPKSSFASVFSAGAFGGNGTMLNMLL